MILSDNQIIYEKEQGNITLSNFNPAHINPNSYDMTLGNTCKILHPGALGYNKYYEHMSSTSENEYLEWASNIEHTEDWHLDPKEKENPFEIYIGNNGLILQPGHLYLYSCVENIGVKGNICAQVQAKSSLGRKGLDIVIGPAGFIDSGFEGSLVLEMRTIYPIKVYPGMKICQIKFERVEGEVEVGYDKKPGSKYMNQVGVQESKYNHNFPIRTLE